MTEEGLYDVAPNQVAKPTGGQIGREMVAVVRRATAHATHHDIRGRLAVMRPQVNQARKQVAALHRASSRLYVAIQEHLADAADNHGARMCNGWPTETDPWSSQSEERATHTHTHIDSHTQAP